MLSAVLAGRFAIGGDRAVARLGFGAMRLTASGAWEQGGEKAAILRTLRALPGLGVEFVDTADSYGPEASENVIREALHPYDGMLIATKGGFRRLSGSAWVADGRPENLIAQANQSRERLGVDQISLWQLHQVDRKVPQDEQFDAVKRLVADRVIRFVGLNDATVDDIKSAQRNFPVATVQARYNLVDRSNQDVLDYCEEQGIGFVPWYPLARGDLARPGGPLDVIARKHRAKPDQIAIAWLLRRSPVILSIPGAAQVSHLKENIGAARIDLSDEETAVLDQSG